jgi:hypothetical protein
MKPFEGKRTDFAENRNIASATGLEEIKDHHISV